MAIAGVCVRLITLSRVSAAGLEDNSYLSCLPGGALKRAHVDPVATQAKVHPEQPGYSVDREAFDRIWFHSVDLLQRGFKSGSILTVDPEDAQKLGKPWTRR